jgi:hypothetical protein
MPPIPGDVRCHSTPALGSIAQKSRRAKSSTLKPFSEQQTDSAGSTKSFEAAIRVVTRSRARAPQTEVPCLSTVGKHFQLPREPSTPASVEVRRSRTYSDQAHIDVQAVTCPDHVTQQPAVLVDGRRLRPVALGAEVHLRRVDLDESYSLPDCEVDCVAVGDMINPICHDAPRSTPAGPATTADAETTNAVVKMRNRWPRDPVLIDDSMAVSSLWVR